MGNGRQRQDTNRFAYWRRHACPPLARLSLRVVSCGRRARARRSVRSRALFVSAAARANSVWASSRRPSLTSRSPRTLGSRWYVLQRRLAGQSVHDRQPLGRAEGHGHGHGPVQLHHRRRGDLGQGVVEGGDARPVGLSAWRARAWQARDGRLEGVGAEGSPAERLGAGQRGQAAPDQEPVPARPVLVQEQDRLAGGVDPGAAGATPGSPSGRPGRAPPPRPAPGRPGCGPGAAPPRTASAASSRRPRSRRTLR